MIRLYLEVKWISVQYLHWKAWSHCQETVHSCFRLFFFCFFCTWAFTHVSPCLLLSPFLQALCINVQCSDVLETLSLIFCGADVNCSTGLDSQPTPLSLATAHSQPLQAELLNHNLNTGTVCVHAQGLKRTFVFNGLSGALMKEFVKVLI